METPAKYSWLDEFLESTEKSLGLMDLSTLQPTSWRHFQPLIASEWLEWFWEILQQREKQNVSYKEIARSLEPALCREHLLFSLEDLKSAQWPLEKRLKIADFFYQALKVQMPHGDLFGLYGSTKRHSPAQIAQILQKDFQKGTPEIARELGRLYNSAYNLGAALYLDFYMGKAIENWGPYHLPDGKILVIKQMRFLKPLEIWPHIRTSSEKIDIYSVYEGVSFSTDLIACHTQYTGDVLRGLRKWRVVRDGKAVTSIETIKKIASNFAQIGAHQWNHLVGLSEQELFDNAVWIRCYCFNKTCTLLGLDWKPTKKLLRAVKNKKLIKGWETWNPPSDKKKLEKYWRNIWDPRKDFYPAHEV